MRGLLLRLRALLSRRAVDEELDDELRLHLELETEKGLRHGLSPEEARRQAHVRFGGVERFREETRSVRGLAVVDGLARDMRMSLRMLRRSPIFALAAVGTLALGIGATTAIFSVVSAVLLRPSPFPDPDRLVMVWETDRASGTRHEPASWPDVVDLRERSRTLSDIGSMMAFAANITRAGRTERTAGLAVTQGFLDALGTKTLAGRSFGPEDWAPAAPRVALLSQEYWASGFGSDPAVVGTTLTVNDAPLEIVGVLPREADLGIRQIHARADYAAEAPAGDVGIWVAFRPDAGEYPRSTHPFLTLGRLAPSIDIQAAQAELEDISAGLETAYPENQDRGVNVEAYSEVVFGPVRSALVVLLGAVFLVLLIACANVASLLLARTVTRSREVSLRRALGASRSQIGRQFVVEAVALSGLGTVLGIGLAQVFLRVLLALAPADVPRLRETGLNVGVLAVVAALGAGVAFAFGLLPAVQTRAVDLAQSLKAQPGRRATEGRTVMSFRSALMVAEVALAVTLVTGAGVVLRGFWALSSVDPGFDATGVVSAGYQLPARRYPAAPDTPGWPDIPATNGFHQALQSRLRAIPGVEAAAIASPHPLDPGFTNSFVIVGREAESADFPEIRIRWVSPGYFQTLGVPLLSGRTIVDGDVATSPPVTLINRAAAERFFPDVDPLGQELRWWGITRRVVGVVGDERFLGLAAAPAPAAYIPVAQGAVGQATLLVRTSADPSTIVPALRDELAKLDPEVPFFDVAPLRSALAESISSPRFTAMLLASFAGLAFFLALVGVHGVLSYAAARRAPEVGIRMALGAARGSVVREIVMNGLRLAGIGVVLGALGALAASRLLRSLVYVVSPVDPATYAVVIGAVLAAALLASLLPALQASGADPGRTLRAE